MSDLVDRQMVLSAIMDTFAKSLAREKAIECVVKVPGVDPTQTNAESAQERIVPTHDSVNRQDAITLMCRALHYNYEEGYAVTQMLALPPVDIDLSVYSNRLWKAAYERGKADAEARWIPVTEPYERRH